MFRLEVSHDLDSLLADGDRWNALAGGVPFRETSWLGPWWRHFGHDKQAFVIVARDWQGEIAGLLPLYRSATPPLGRALAMIGDGDACSDYVSILAKPNQATEIAEQMGRFLAECSTDPENGWDVLSMDGVVHGDQPMVAFASALKSSGSSVHAQSRMSTWFKPADESWEAHLKHFSKTHRRKMRRWSEVVKKTEALQHVCAKSPEQVDQMLDAMIELHQRRWSDAGVEGSYGDASFRAFVREAAQSFADSGRLYLPTLRLQGRTIGGELHFVGGDDRLYCYSSGYDIEASDWEPGRVLAAQTLLHLYQENLAGIDYLRGDEPYKKRMSATPIRLYHFRAVAPAWLPRLRHAAWCTGFEFKQWMRRHTGRPLVEVADFSETLACPSNE